MDSTHVFAGPEPPQPEHPDAARRLLEEVLAVVRSHFGMEVAFVATVAAGRRVVEYVDSTLLDCPIEPGLDEDRDQSYCGRVLDGRAPELIRDAAQEPSVADLAATWSIPVRSHLSVPVVTADGEPFGTLCCFSRSVVAGLDDKDLGALRMFAAIVGRHLEPILARKRRLDLARERIQDVLEADALRMAMQPIVSLGSRSVTGYEALARFPDSTGWPPDRWFAAADRVGLGTQLEAAAVRTALDLLPDLPPARTLAVNVSATALLDGSDITCLLCGPHSGRLVLELTEHQAVADPDALLTRLEELRTAGVRVAVDDAGSGYAGLEWILHLRPEVLKLDRSLVDGIADHPGRQAMCEAMVGFTERTGSRLVAEGVETERDLVALQGLGVGHAQGYLLGRPAFWSAKVSA